MGSRSTLSCEIDEDQLGRELHWQMNYHEAAIFLEVPIAILLSIVSYWGSVI